VLDIKEKIRKRIERLEAQRECAEFFNERDSMRKYGFAMRELEKNVERTPRRGEGRDAAYTSILWWYVSLLWGRY